MSYLPGEIDREEALNAINRAEEHRVGSTPTTANLWACWVAGGLEIVRDRGAGVH